MKRKLYLETFGCQMNVLDSELVLGQLHAHGYEPTDDNEADAIAILLWAIANGVDGGAR